jgi:hypothetical protein
MANAVRYNPVDLILQYADQFHPDAHYDVHAAFCRGRLYLVFLDMDGVFNNLEHLDRLDEEARFQAERLFGKKTEYSLGELRAGVAEVFEPEALANFHYLLGVIRRIQARLEIVISSSWRNGFTVEQLRDQILKKHAFSRHIIDKTVDDDSHRHKQGLPRLSPLSKQKYGFELTSRGAQILYWCNENSQKTMEATDFLTIDDVDDQLTAFCGEKYIQTRNYFAKQNLMRAIHVLGLPTHRGSKVAVERLQRQLPALPNGSSRGPESPKAAPPKKQAANVALPHLAQPKLNLAEKAAQAHSYLNLPQKQKAAAHSPRAHAKKPEKDAPTALQKLVVVGSNPQSQTKS